MEKSALEYQKYLSFLLSSQITYHSMRWDTLYLGISNQIVSKFAKIVFTAFVKVYLAEDDELACIGNLKVVESGNIIAKYYSVFEHALLCTVESNFVSMDEVNDIAKKVLEICSIKCRVIVLHSDNIANYHKERSEVYTSLMRHLKSSHWITSLKLCPLLEQPNVIGAIPAALLTLCELEGRSGCILIQYAISNNIDSSTMEGYDVIKKELQKQCELKVDKSQIQTRLKRLTNSVANNVLYT